MHEVEIKLSVDDPFVTPPLAQTETGISGMRELPALDLRATYYDTQDLRLARRGVTLRYRSGEGNTSQWTLKLPIATGHALKRDELTFEGGARAIPDAARDLVSAFVRTAELGPVTRLRTRRRRWALHDADGTELAELVDDRVSVLQRNRVVARFRELEVEARAAGGTQLDEIAAALRRAGAAPTATPKALRALGARALAPPDVVAPRRITSGEPAAFAVQAAIARSLERIMLHDPGTRLGDVESLHQMRVGTRRLRSDLRTFSSLVRESWVQERNAELRRLGGALGSVRDLDVLSERLERTSGGLRPQLGDLFDELAGRRERARARLLAILREHGYAQMLDRLVDAGHDPALTSEAWRPSKEVLPSLAAKAARKLARAGRRLDRESQDSDYHRVRILAKRARYASEAIVPAMGGRSRREADRFARRAARVQDVLGELQDTSLAAGAIETFANKQPAEGATCFASGRLAERQRRDGLRAREQFPKTWKRLMREMPSDWKGLPEARR